MSMEHIKTSEEHTTTHKGDDDMSNTVKTYGTLNMHSLKNKKGKIISSKDALRDVKPIEWGDEILRGEKRIIATKEKK